ncbi:MAG: hypothetical protein OXC18_07070 [Desulfurellaceae bacterium]|nr:hypothetical protein [Desulfurellaceae bacterium]
MAGSQMRVHKKMDKIFQRLDALEDNDKALTKQTKYLKQLVVLAKQDSARQRKESKKRMCARLLDNKGDGKKAKKKKR